MAGERHSWMDTRLERNKAGEKLGWKETRLEKNKS